MRTLTLRLAAGVLALGLDACAAHGHTYPSPLVQSALVQIEVQDRADGTALPVYAKDAHRYIVGTPGHEYALRIRNRTAARVLVVSSVDGVNVISGETAAPAQSGYVLDPWSSVEITGWRKSLERTAAFFFTEHRSSYAARTGRPNDVGVIGVAVFRERARPVSRREPQWRRGEVAAESTAQAPAAADSATAGASRPAAEPRERDAADALAQPEQANAAAKTPGRLGTGHGRSEASRVTVVSFERASETPAQTIAIQYDRRERLIAMGVLPAPSPQLTRREPEPFPGAMRFAPDPQP